MHGIGQSGLRGDMHCERSAKHIIRLHRPESATETALCTPANAAAEAISTHGNDTLAILIAADQHTTVRDTTDDTTRAPSHSTCRRDLKP